MSGVVQADRTKLGLGFVLLCLYFFMEYVRPQDLFAPLAALRLPMLLQIVIPLVWLRYSGGRLPADPLIKWYLAFVLITAASVVFSVNQYWVLESTKFSLYYLLAAILPATVFLAKPEALARFFRYWLLLQTLVAVYALSHQGVGTGSFLSDENDLALAMGMAIPFAYFLMQSPRAGALGRAACALALVLMVGAIVVSGSRGGFLGMVAVAMGIVYFSRNRLRNFILVALMAGLALLVVPAGYKEEVRSIHDVQDATRNERLYSWGLAWSMFLDNPLGVGAGNFPFRVGEYEARANSGYDPVRMRSVSGRAAHSLYFTLIPELGIPGIVVFTVMAVGLARRAREATRTIEAKPQPTPLELEMALLGRAMRVSLVGFLVSGAFVTVLYYPHFWYLLGFAVALRMAVVGQHYAKKTMPVFDQPIAVANSAVSSPPARRRDERRRPWRR